MRWLTAQTTQQTILLTALFLLMAVATILLACGPAAQPAPADDVALPAAPDGGGSEEPTVEPTVDANPKYPKLHATLQNLVQDFESGNLTESQAAAQAPLYHADEVLVTVDVATNIDAIDTWMGGQSISSRRKIVDEVVSYFYAYVPVSLLGALSRQSGVTLVSPSVPPWADLSDYTAGASGAVGAAGSSGNVIQVEGTPTPTPDPANPESPDIPIWLKGAHPYPRLRPPLRSIVYRYEQGEITEAAAAAEAGNNYGSAVYVDTYVVDDPAKTDAIVAWLRGKDITPNKVIQGHAIIGYIPVSVLGELSNQPGVTYIVGTHKSSTNQEPPEGPQGKSSEPPPTGPTPTPQGFAVHGANNWYAGGYNGSGIKVGIIDDGFAGSSRLLGTELPPSSKVTARCYAYSNPPAPTPTPTPSPDITNCVNNTAEANYQYHGTIVTQAVADVAPDAELYVSNGAFGASPEDARKRIYNDVVWMANQGVDVINYSRGWDFSSGLGDGIPRFTAVDANGFRTDVDVLDAVNSATDDFDILWVNSAGNKNQRIWHGAFSGNTDRYHDFATGDDKNYLLISDGRTRFNGGAGVTIEMRWDDSWGSANCDLDMYLFKESGDGSVTVINARDGADSQRGREGDYSYETIQVSASGAGSYYLKVRKSLCTDSSDLSWFQLYVHGTNTLEHAATGGSLVFPADSRNSGMLVAGAAGWSNTSTIQRYSGQGPTTDGRIKPELVGADCATAVTRVASTGVTRASFCGTSQAAPHIAGLAALVLNRYKSAWGSHYTAADVANWLKDAATQRTEPSPNNTDPNNIWGHGFVTLPNPAPTASYTVAPSAVTVGESQTFRTLQVAAVGSGVRVAINHDNDTGNLSFSSTCPAGANVSRERTTSNHAVTVYGCESGTATVRLYKTGTNVLLRIYEVTVNPAPSIEINDLASYLSEDASDAFSVAVSHLKVGQTYTVALTTGNDNIGFNTSCGSTATSTSFTPTTSSRTINFTLYACDAPGGTLTATIRKGSTSGTVVDTDTAAVNVQPAGYRPILTGKLMGSSTFRVYRQGNTLFYYKQPCVASHVQQRFFLHLTPSRVTDLPASRRQLGFDNKDFNFSQHGLRFGDRCLAVVPLPSYTINQVSTGQTRLSGSRWVNTWSVTFSGQAVGSSNPAFLYGELMADTTFDVYRQGKTVYYYKSPCTAADTSRRFAVHIYPVAVSSLPSQRRQYGFDNKDFSFGNHGWRFDGKCLAVRQLPNYAINRVNTGQAWRIGFAMATVSRPYDTIVAGTPKARSTFNVYLKNNTLYYAKSPCTAANVTARFALHIYPRNQSDLPAHRRRYHFDNKDFLFDRRGLLSSGKCLEVIPLPNYSITRINTGQSGSRGRLWTVNFRP